MCSGKDHLLILDFLWLTDRHDLCRPSALIAKDEIWAEHIDRKMQDGMDLVEAAEATEADAIADREAVLVRELEELRKKRAKLVDPIQYAFSIYNSELVNYVPTFAWESEPATEEQMRDLMDCGINPTGVTQGHADLLLKSAHGRNDDGYATPKQIRLLEKYGFKNVATWDRTVATKMTKRLIRANWRVPRTINPAEYHGMTPQEVNALKEDGEDPWKKMF